MKHLCLFLSFLAVTSGCTRELSHSQAQHIIESSPLVKPADDHVVVDAISSPSPTEAIVRATIAGETTNLKFRKYDTGWTWEFQETKGGGWIAPDQGVGQIREANRQRRIVQWVAKNQDAYRTSIEAVDELCGDVNLPHRLDMPFTVGQWLANRKSSGEMSIRLIADSLHYPKAYTPEATTPEGIERRRRRAQGLIAPPAVTDAWGSELLINFDVGDHQAVFLSMGPDKQKGTDDDVVCVAKGRKETWDLGGPGELRWAYDLSWVVPEGLDFAVSTHVTKTFGSVQYAKLLKP